MRPPIGSNSNRPVHRTAGRCGNLDPYCSARRDYGINFGGFKLLGQGYSVPGCRVFSACLQRVSYNPGRFNGPVSCPERNCRSTLRSASKYPITANTVTWYLSGTRNHGQRNHGRRVQSPLAVRTGPVSHQPMKMNRQEQGDDISKIRWMALVVILINSRLDRSPAQSEGLRLYRSGAAATPWSGARQHSSPDSRPEGLC